MIPVAFVIFLSGFIISEKVVALDFPSADSIASAIEQRYHLDPAVIRRYGESFNVSENKGNAPEVTIAFSPSDPKDGQKLSAKAFPTYFSNASESQLYYTWYLKRNGCELGGSSGQASYCDSDNDGSVTVNDWKVAASRILATDNADSNGFKYDTDDDNDGYKAHFGGELVVDTKKDWCYMHDPVSGHFYELPACVHLFPELNGSQVGGTDGTFGLSDEKAWGTNPHDPDTSGNGNKDEANAVGLGRDTFKWNYQTGDKVGVLVEGSSMVATKHDDATMMVQWGFSKNKKCPIKNPGSYIETVHGYPVTFLTTSLTKGDIDDCLEMNLVDPMDSESGSSKKLELSVSATPDNPVNDKTEGIGGDMVTATASVDNSSKSPEEITYSWTVELSNNPVDGWKDVTAQLEAAGLLTAGKLITLPNSTTQAISQNGLTSIKVLLDMKPEILGTFANTDPVYMRITTRAGENYSATTYTATASGGSTVAQNMIARPEGKSDVVVKVTNTDKKISTYTTTATASTSGAAQVALDTSIDPICDMYYPTPSTAAEAKENLNRISCRVMKNEILGVTLRNATSTEWKNFRWTINGAALNCSSTVSSVDCPSGGLGNTAFFAVTGEPGETYTVRMEAVNVATGKALSLSRNYQVVDPEILLESNDTSAVWPRYVGTFTELDGTKNDEHSDEIFERFASGTVIPMKASIIPGYAKKYLLSHVWTVDGKTVDESADMQIAYTLPKPGTIGDANFVNFTGKIVQANEKRVALRDLWGVNVIDSSETKVVSDVRVQAIANEDLTVASSGSNRFFAAVSKYVPPFVVFAVRMILTSAFLLFSVGFVSSLIPASEPDDRRSAYRR